MATYDRAAHAAAYREIADLIDQYVTARDEAGGGYAPGEREVFLREREVFLRRVERLAEVRAGREEAGR